MGPRPTRWNLGTQVVASGVAWAPLPQHASDSGGWISHARALRQLDPGAWSATRRRDLKVRRHQDQSAASRGGARSR
jgi:hypothetical protein